jgi:asparagine synthetase B (glutamine-hydrolysing)
MTLFAGIYSRDAQYALPESACDALVRALSRDPSDVPQVFRDERCFIVKVDIGAYGEPGMRVDAGGAVSALAGEPLLGDANVGREKDLELLHESWLKGDWNVLARARGVFCAAHYNPAKRELSLVADKLCVRPLYYWTDERYVVFATSLRALESVELVPKELDVRAVCEIAGINVPLGARTPYANVLLPGAAEVVRFEGSDSSRISYWRWEEIEPSSRPEAELVRDAYERFTEAVALRARRDTETFASLSGGLDSRCVVAALRGRGVRLHTFNFSPQGSQDQVFGAAFARGIGTTHHEAARNDEGGPDWSQMLADAWNEARAQGARAERPLLGWSGDGGSVGLGHVYINQEIVAFMREGNRDAAAASYLRKWSVDIPERFFKTDVAAALSDVLRRGVREELDALHCSDPGRAFYLFLMLNDQRRHLARHFEDIDRHRIELQLPFYDSDFLSLIMSVPLDLCLGHKFYTKFLACFPPEATSVPWQTYPGHDPCPLPVPEGLSYQWGDADARAAQKRFTTERARALLGASNFPEELFDRGWLRLATLIHRTGVRDYGYVIEAVSTYHKYWALTGGRYRMPPSPQDSDAPSGSSGRT